MAKPCPDDAVLGSLASLQLHGHDDVLQASAPWITSGASLLMLATTCWSALALDSMPPASGEMQGQKGRRISS